MHRDGGWLVIKTSLHLSVTPDPGPVSVADGQGPDHETVAVGPDPGPETAVADLAARATTASHAASPVTARTESPAASLGVAPTPGPSPSPGPGPSHTANHQSSRTGMEEMAPSRMRMMGVLLVAAQAVLIKAERGSSGGLICLVGRVKSSSIFGDTEAADGVGTNPQPNHPFNF